MFSPYYYPPPDLELKRKYLALLPTQQIIDLCLTFDSHVPPYIKSTVWPPDLSAAIANLEKQKPPSADVPPPENVMHSLKSPNPDPPQTEAQPSDQAPPSTSNASPSADSQTEPSAPAPTPTPSTSQTPTPQPSASVTADPATPYPHQPYPYPHTASYPHAPYYTTPGGYPYPYSSYPPPPMPNGYHPPVPQGYPPHPPTYNAPFPMPPSAAAQPQDTPSDDLPSYEEMIVEALTENPDPEGCAPKDFFAWMASRYPVQSNFRPSASQALQKAFKRGRLEKGSNGKYRLNATWGGGSTSRRTTRRPQVQNAPPRNPQNASSSSPFTHAPRAHPSSTHAPFPPQLYGYPYPTNGAYPGYPVQPPTPAAAASASQKAPAKTPTPTDTETEDTYAAANAILKAINEGNLLQLPPEELSKEPPGSMSASASAHAMVDNGVEHLLSQLQSALAAEGPPPPASHPPSSFHPQVRAAHPPSAAPTNGNGNSSTVPGSTEARAELQAQLALLAAQLVDFAQLEDTQAQPRSQSQPQPQVQWAIAPVPAPAPHLTTPPEPSTGSRASTTSATPAPGPSSTTPAPPPADALPPNVQDQALREVETALSQLHQAIEVEQEGEDEDEEAEGEDEDSDEDDDMEEVNC